MRLTRRWWSETMTPRLNNRKTGVYREGRERSVRALDEQTFSKSYLEIFWWWIGKERDGGEEKISKAPSTMSP